jgi:PspAA-like protein
MKMAKKDKVRKKSHSRSSTSRRASKSTKGKVVGHRKPHQKRGPKTGQEGSRSTATKQRYSIVRIMGRGQYRLNSAAVHELNTIDNAIVKLVEEEVVHSGESDLESRFKEKLTDIVSLITSKGKEVDPKEIIVSDFIVPPVDATINEARSLFRGEGLIPG